MNAPANTAIDTALKQAFSHIRDVSLRDGVQSWDSNRWKTYRLAKGYYKKLLPNIALYYYVAPSLCLLGNRYRL